ncbi:MAG TPA: hypothetical protein VGE31_02790 [Candidatus Paceibacterota bacterium]
MVEQSVQGAGGSELVSQLQLLTLHFFESERAHARVIARLANPPVEITVLPLHRRHHVLAH